jgi:hypothetical protein
MGSRARSAGVEVCGGAGFFHEIVVVEGHTADDKPKSPYRREDVKFLR